MPLLSYCLFSCHELATNALRLGQVMTNLGVMEYNLGVTEYCFKVVLFASLI